MKERNTGLDLCRIISMLGIVILHVIGKGGALQTVSGQYTMKQWMIELLFICALCSVNVFALMSGYFGIDKKRTTVYRAIELIVIVFFWCVVLTVGLFFVKPDTFTIRNLLIGFFPIIDGGYWYIVNFVPLLFLQPFINKMLLGLSEKQHFMLCTVAISIFTIIPTILMEDCFKFDEGYSFVWLLCLYVFGAYLRRAKSYKISQNLLIGIFIVCAMALVLGNWFIYFLLGANYRYFVTYNSPVVFFMSVVAFLYFANLTIKKAGKILYVLSLVAFDVYIIHGQVLVWEYIIKDAFVWISNLALYCVIPAILISAIGIYMICTILGWIRVKIFNVLCLNQLIQKCSVAVDKVAYSNAFKYDESSLS